MACPTNGWDVLKIFCLCSFFVIISVIVLANVNNKCNVTNVTTPNVLTSINDIVESNIYESQLKGCPNVITEYATYLNSVKIQYVKGAPCPDPTMLSKDKAVGDWTVCYPPGTLAPPPQQLLTDLGECNLTVTAAAPWTLVKKAPPSTLSTYTPEVSYVVI